MGIPTRVNKAMCFTGHDKATPSLSFKPDANTWKCFGACGKHGDAIALVMEVLDLNFKSALAWFDSAFGVRVRGRRDKRVPDAFETQSPQSPNSAPRRSVPTFQADPEIYSWLIGKCGPVASPTGLAYLKQHAISAAMTRRFAICELTDARRALERLVETWGAERVYRAGLVLGDGVTQGRLIWWSYALLFPFFQHDTVTYIQGRQFQSRAKYLNPRGVAKPLFNSEQLRTLVPGSTIHICEGIPDAIALESVGLRAVGILGATSFRPEWVELFMSFNVVLTPDGDAGGDTFLSTIRLAFAARGKAVRSIRVQPGEDVASILATEGRHR